MDKALLGVMVALEVHEKYKSEIGEAYSLWRLRFWKIKGLNPKSFYDGGGPSTTSHERLDPKSRASRPKPRV